MITNLDEPRVREIRQKICFRDTRFMYYKDNLGKWQPASEMPEIKKSPNEYNYSCVICWQSVIDPKRCDRCNIKFCHYCRVELTRFLIGCPNETCAESSCSRIPENDPYRLIFDKLWLKCTNEGCSQMFSMAVCEASYLDHFNKCTKKPLRCTFCHSDKDFLPEALQHHYMTEC